MPILEAEAVVLRQYTLGEADRIIVFFTREFGKVRAVARGVRKPKSRLGGCLEPLTNVKVEFFAREGADLGRIHRCEIIHSYLSHGAGLDRVYGFTYFSEIVQEMGEDNNPNALLFRLFISVLNAGEAVGITEALVRYFEAWSLKLNGLLPDYGTCSVCGKCVIDFGFYAWLEAGQGRCAECSGGRGVYVRPVAALALQEIATLAPQAFALRPLDAHGAGDLERLLQRHLEWQLGKRLRSYPALREMLRGR